MPIGLPDELLDVVDDEPELLDAADDALELLDVEVFDELASDPPAPAVPPDELDEDSPPTWRSGAQDGASAASDKATMQERTKRLDMAPRYVGRPSA